MEVGYSSVRNIIGYDKGRDILDCFARKMKRDAAGDQNCEVGACVKKVRNV